jgi:hypothetical protein
MAAINIEQNSHSFHTRASHYAHVVLARSNGILPASELPVLLLRRYAGGWRYYGGITKKQILGFGS